MGSTKVPSSIYALYDCACVVLSLGAGPPGHVINCACGSIRRDACVALGVLWGGGTLCTEGCILSP